MPSRLKRARRQPTVEGRRAVLEALRSGRPIERILMAERVTMGRLVGEIVQLAEAAGVVVKAVDRNALDRASVTGHHQGVIALVPDARYASIDDLLEAAQSSGEPALIAVLDGVQDPHNLGAIARTADAAGANGLILPTRRAAGISPGAIRASAGALEHIPVARVANVSRCIDRLKAAGLWIVGLDPAGATRYTEVDFAAPTAIIIGGEEQGMSRLVHERCDIIASLPLRGRIASLNASVAAAVVLYEAVRQRAEQRTPPDSRM